MGQKVHPHGMRLGITKYWDSTWYANNKNFSNYLENDFLVRSYLFSKLDKAAISRIIIERTYKSIFINIYTARPGIIVGKKGEDIEKLRKKIINLIKIKIVQIKIYEINKPELDAKLIADNIAIQLEQRILFRRAMKKAVQNAMRLGAKGIKIKISGRLGGAEIARKEWCHEGRVPLHTLRANIDYYVSKANTSYGSIGIKVWVFKGEIFDKKSIIEQNKLYYDKYKN